MEQMLLNGTSPRAYPKGRQQLLLHKVSMALPSAQQAVD